MNKISKLLFVNIFSILFFSGNIFAQTKFNTEGPNPFENIGCKEFIGKLTAKEKSNIAGSLNQIGFNLYKKGEIEEAAKYFHCATKANSKHVIAHYNYACALSILRKGMTICDTIFRQDIEDHLRIAIQLDPKRRDRMIIDPDFQNVREYGFFKILSLPSNIALKDALIKNGTWYSVGIGVNPAHLKIDFHENGSVTIRRFNIEKFEVNLDLDIESRYDLFRGTFVVKENNIYIKYIESEKKDECSAIIKYSIKKGVFEFLEILFDGETLFPADEDCSA